MKFCNVFDSVFCVYFTNLSFSLLARGRGLSMETTESSFSLGAEQSGEPGAEAHKSITSTSAFWLCDRHSGRDTPGISPDLGSGFCWVAGALLAAGMLRWTGWMGFWTGLMGLRTGWTDTDLDLFALFKRCSFLGWFSTSLSSLEYTRPTQTLGFEAFRGFRSGPLGCLWQEWSLLLVCCNRAGAYILLVLTNLYFVDGFVLPTSSCFALLAVVTDVDVDAGIFRLHPPTAFWDTGTGSCPVVLLWACTRSKTDLFSSVSKWPLSAFECPMTTVESVPFGGMDCSSDLSVVTLAHSVLSLHGLIDFRAFFMRSLSRSEQGSFSGKSLALFGSGPAGDPESEPDWTKSDPDASVSTRAEDTLAILPLDAAWDGDVVKDQASQSMLLRWRLSTTVDVDKEVTAGEAGGGRGDSSSLSLSGFTSCWLTGSSVLAPSCFSSVQGTSGRISAGLCCAAVVEFTVLKVVVFFSDIRARRSDMSSQTSEDLSFLLFGFFSANTNIHSVFNAYFNILVMWITYYTCNHTRVIYKTPITRILTS